MRKRFAVAGAVVIIAGVTPPPTSPSSPWTFCREASPRCHDLHFCNNLPMPRTTDSVTASASSASSTTFSSIVAAGLADGTAHLGQATRTSARLSQPRQYDASSFGWNVSCWITAPIEQA